MWAHKRIPKWAEVTFHKYMANGNYSYSIVYKGELFYTNNILKKNSRIVNTQQCEKQNLMMDEAREKSRPLNNKKKIVINWYECECLNTKEYVHITYNGKKFMYPYFWDFNEWIKNNSPMISAQIENELEKRINTIMSELSTSFEKTIEELGKIKQDRTKPILLAKVMEHISGDVKKLADMFEEPTIKNSLTKLFNWLK